jgi:P4 family phage/plasmid primase-like protien
MNTFRPGRPDDYLSKNMPINYTIYTEDDEKVQDVMTFLEQVFPDKSVRKYFMDVSSDIFVGGNHEKIVLFWTGEGDNGKSVTQLFFDMMMGKLAIKLNTNVITGKKPSAGAAFADLARAGGGVRWAVLEEPDSDEVINTGIFKHLSGNDTFYARDLFEKGKDGREICPMFKLIFVCNKLPRIKAADKAVWNRVRVIPFEAIFCRPDNPAPESYEEQLRQKRFPMDKQFSKKIPALVEAFAWILLQHRLKIANQPRTEPEKVRAATEIYRRQNDIYRQFIEESIIEDPNKSMSLAELYNLFKDWFKESLPGHTVPVKNEIEEYFVKIWGTPEGKKWKGYRQKTLKDDIENGEAIVLTEDDLVDYSEKKE